MDRRDSVTLLEIEVEIATPPGSALKRH
jgi:hypothetical protein